MFCLRDPRSDVISGRFCLGEGVDAVMPHVRIAAGGTDLFALVCAKGADTLIRDASARRTSRSGCRSGSRATEAPSFPLLPLSIKGAPVGLIYADTSVAGGIVLEDKELSAAHLRNQAVMALRQQGG